MTHFGDKFTYTNNVKHLTLTKINNILKMGTIIIINRKRKFTT